MLSIVKVAASEHLNYVIHGGRYRPDVLPDFQRPVKIKDKVRSLEDAFQDFIKRDAQMQCFGQQCLHCILNGFCRDITELKRTKILKSKPAPICLKKECASKEIFAFDDKFNLYKFLDFYIRRRYHVKSLRCSMCMHNAVCQGAQIEKVVRNGLEILHPIRPQIIMRHRTSCRYTFSDECDLQCVFCDIRETWTQDVKKIKEDFAHLHKQGIKEIEFAGTEPLNHPAIIDVVKMASKFFSSIQLCTASKKLADKEFVAKIITPKVKCIDIPLYGASAGVHDSIVGKSGAFNNTMKSLDNLKNNKVRIEIHTLLLKRNVKEFPELFKLLRDKHPQVKFSVFALRPTFLSRLSYEEMVPRLNAIKKSMQIIKDSLKMNHKYKRFRIHFVNIPLCSIVNTTEELDKKNVSFDCSFSAHREFEWCNFSDKCSSCIMYKKPCLGLPQAYFNLFGDKEVTPIIGFDK